jgi:hypothetical protein
VGAEAVARVKSTNVHIDRPLGVSARAPRPRGARGTARTATTHRHPTHAPQGAGTGRSRQERRA